MEKEKIIGFPAPRKEGRDKVTGKARYIDDITLPNMLYGATVRSRIARGRIKKITFGPGIPWDEFVIVSAKDIPGKNYIALIENDQPCLAAEAVNHPEEPILLLAHPDKHLLPKAVEAVAIEYEPLPAVFNIADSERPTEVIWGKDNIFKTYLIEKGDVDAVWDKAAFIVEGRILYRRAGATLHRDERDDRAVRSGPGRHGMGFAAVSLLRSQGVDGRFRLARRKSSRGAGGNGRRVRRQGRISLDDCSACGAAGDEVRAAGEDDLRPPGRHGRYDQASSVANAPSHGRQQGRQDSRRRNRIHDRRRRVSDALPGGALSRHDSRGRALLLAAAFASVQKRWPRMLRRTARFAVSARRNPFLPWSATWIASRRPSVYRRLRFGAGIF